ncbi:MAG: GGDEF domain-containing protein [bacterium]|nr:GGDEF domain-containing protein [bacterium]
MASRAFLNSPVCVALFLLIAVALPIRLAAQDDRSALLAQAESSSGEEQVELFNQLSKSYWAVSADDALQHAERAKVLAAGIDYARGEADAWRNIGIAYWYMSDYEASSGAVLEARKIYDEIGDARGVAASLSTMGTIQMQLENYELGIALYEEALPIAEAAGDDNRVGILLSNLGTQHLGLEKPREALVYLNRAVEVLTRNGSQLSLLTCLANIGGAHKRLGEFQQALDVNQEVLRIADEAGSHERYADALGDIGLSYAGLGQDEKALEYLQRSIVFSEEKDLKRSQRSGFVDLSNFFEKRGRFSEALAVFKRYVELRKTIFDEEGAQAMAGMRVKYETEKKEREIQIQRLEIENQKDIQRALIVIVLISAVAGVIVFVLYQQKRRANIELDRLSRTDPLTGLANRRSLLDAARTSQLRAQRFAEPYSVILMDIDHFKRFNDEHGHDCGDAVLKAVASAIRESVREIDIAARWGGEEFLVLCPGTDIDGAEVLADRVHQAVRSTTVAYGGLPHRVTITAGIGQYKGNDSFDSVIQYADEALYRGKTEGRDRIVVA